MFLTVIGPVGHEENATIANRGLSLRTVFGEYGDAIEACFVNSRPMTDWGNYIPQKNDRVKVHIRSGPWTIPLWVQLIISLVLTAISIGLSFALAPKQAKLKGDNSQAWGISGFQNTTGQGTPIPVWYGINRVLPHIIAGGVDVTEDHKNMVGRVLYCIGDTGGDEYESISDVLLDDVPVSQYEGLKVDYRLGSLTQSAIPEFENVSTPWYDGRTLPWDDSTNSGTPLFYTTKSNQVQRLAVTLNFAGGLWRINKAGNRRNEIVTIYIWIKAIGAPDSAYTIVPPDSGMWMVDPYSWHFEGQTQSALFHKINIETSMVTGQAWTRYLADYPDVAADPQYNQNSWTAYLHYVQVGRDQGRIWHGELSAGGQWDVKVQINGSHSSFPDDEPHGAACALYNVEETEFTTQTYPGYALLALTNIPAKQIKSLQSMKVSCLVYGKKCRDPFTGSKVFTRFRPWIVRDLMTGPCGMDYEFDEAEIDNLQWGDEGSYYNDSVPSQAGGSELRDYCDFGLNDRKWDWDWVRSVAGEGRAIVVPSGDKWKYLIDKPGSPNLLYCEPGNIIEDSIQIEVGPQDEDPFNQAIAEFRDAEDNYNPALTQPINGPDAPYPSIIQKAVHYDTITRESEASRELMIILKRQWLERRRWSFISPLGKLVGEPMDLDWFAERVIGDIGAWTGFLPGGVSATTITLPQEVTLEVGTTYLLTIQKRDNSTAESKQVTTGPGVWIQIDVATPFSAVPVEGDMFAMGRLQLDHHVTRLRDLSINADGTVKQVRTEYVAEVYNPDALPAKAGRRRFPYVSIPPIPLWDAAVTNQLVQRKDGSWGTVVMYDVTPAPTVHSTVVSGAALWSADTMVVNGQTTEPSDDNVFLGAYLRMTTGVAAGEERLIVAYRATYRQYQIAPLSATPNAGDHFQVYWKSFSDFYGFKIEMSVDGGSYVEIAKAVGTHYERDGGDQGGTWIYRFTPFNSSGVENRQGQIYRTVTITGDTTAPPAPSQIGAVATLKVITVTANVYDVPLDFAGVDVEVYWFQWFGGVRQIIQNVGASRVGASQSNPVTVSQEFDIRWVNLPYSALLYARARSVDYSNNVSAWFQGPDFSPNRLATLDYGANSITTISYVYSDSPTPIGSSDTYLLYARIIATTVGGSVDLQAKVSTYLAQNSVDAGASYYIGRSDSPGNFAALTVLDSCSDAGTGGVMMAVDNVPAGTYIYELWAQFVASAGGFVMVGYKFKVQENRGGIA